jgi:hypothetical protein
MKKTKLNYYILNILGFIMIIWYIWVRFIMQRLPKDIPFNLSLLSLFVIIVTCITFIIILKQTIRPSVSLLLQTLTPFLYNIFKPLYALDLLIKQNVYVDQVIHKMVSKLTVIAFLDIQENYKFYFIWNFTPRIILLMLLYIDVFYFHKLSLIYSFIFLSAITLIMSYFYHLLQYYYEIDLAFLEKWYEIKIISTNTNPDFDYAEDLTPDGWGYFKISTFLGYQTQDSPIKYEWGITWDVTHKYYPKTTSISDLTADQLNVIKKDFDDLMPIVINMYKIMYDYRSLFTIYNSEINWTTIYTFETKIRKMNIIIYSLYLSCWLYILFVSFPTLMVSPGELQYLKSLQEFMEPFSQTSLL